jgi:hypothetical protein
MNRERRFFVAMEELPSCFFAMKRTVVILLLTRLQLYFHENTRKKLKLNEKYGIMNVQDKLKVKKLVF